MPSTRNSDSIRPFSVSHQRCASHPEQNASRACSRCGKLGCQRCVQSSLGEFRCARCAKTRGFFLARVSVLLTILILVVFYGYLDKESRRARTEWGHSLSVAVVVVTEKPVSRAVLELLEQRLPVLEEQLAGEFARYRNGPRPFQFVWHGPVRAGAPPALPESDSWLELARHQYRQWRYLSAIDRAGAVDSSRYDSRIYLVARPAANHEVQFVEGHGEQGGRVGVIEVELEVAMVDMVLSVVAHELFHTLGAEDKYDGIGRTQIPEGLAEPHLSPVLPQRYVEVMARNRPVAVGRERSLQTLDELRVGPLTAREIKWLD